MPLSAIVPQRQNNQQGGGGQNPMQAYSFYNQYIAPNIGQSAGQGAAQFSSQPVASTAASGNAMASPAASGGGLGAAGIGGIIAAAIAAQHGLSNATSRQFEGVRTDDAFGGHFGTEPWFGWLSERWGLPITAGEKFDAAIANKDYGTALKRMPAMMDYWADPGRSWGNALGRKTFGKTFDKVLPYIDPASYLLGKIGD